MNYKEKFKEAIKINTSERSNLKVFQKFIFEVYPFLNDIEHYIFDQYSMLFHIPGQTEEHILLMSHYDVIPAEKEKWTYDPFSATENNGYVYGRGTLDTKCTLMAILEALEKNKNIKPKKHIWISFGGDEESGGKNGAMKIAQWFKEKNIKFDWILDEGSEINNRNKLHALIGIKEKGSLHLKLSAKQRSGNTDYPPEEQSIALISNAITKLNKKQFPLSVYSYLMIIARQIKFPGLYGFFLRHPILLKPFFIRAMKYYNLSPLFKNIIVFTHIESSNIKSSLPDEAYTNIVIRYMKPWTKELMFSYVKKIINNDDVKIDIIYQEDFIDSTSNKIDFKELNILRDIYPGIKLYPYLMTGKTDSRHFKDMGQIFRFSPFIQSGEEMRRIHNKDERISIDNLNACLNFYYNLIKIL